MQPTRWNLSVSNFPFSYKLSWLPRFLAPSLTGDRGGFAPFQADWAGPAPHRTARLAFVGDISAVANRAAPTVDPEIREVLAAADLVVGNCESPVVEKARAPLGTALGLRHAMSGSFLADALEAAGVSRRKLVLSIANNHALDQGVEGFDETLAVLKRLGIRVVGLAGEPVARVAIDGWAIGFLAFTQWRNAAPGDFAGRVSMASDARPGDDAAGCDLVCALPHWDREFRHFPRAETRALARRLRAAGAGLIVGSHAHVVQPVERLDGTLVAYGLGDFLGTALPRQPWPGRIGAVLATDISLDPPTRGRIAGYRLHFFLRRRDRDRERLIPVESLEGALRDRVFARLRAIRGA
jgi:poly-gamma-glutamate synthesis protein (capsule biosynthesis protein)